MNDYSSSSAAGAGLFLVFMPFLIFGLAATFLMIIASWKILTKAGQPGWACLIPIYSAVVQLQVIGKPWWHMFLFLIPFYNIYLAIVYTNLLSKSFGKDAGFTVGLIFLGIIFYPILAFSNSIQYVGPGGVPSAASVDNSISAIGVN